ncbi:terminal uridylyltransferase 4-like, partial [Sinocyclocheilus grahami]|uniref:terminal uridylyltransferase 4-like n=1 Tax=Sinocyclocheilus grahami TaxID=75366 RepID=UPI0007AC7743
IKGFDEKRVDEFHLTGMESDSFVGWEHRPAPSGEGRGDGKAKPEPKTQTEKKEKKAEHAKGKTRLTLEEPVSASLGQLWLELLRFYTLGFALEEHIISIRLKELLPRELKNWPRRRLAIEDPFALKRNVARSLNSQMVFEYIQERFRTAYKYFACPQSRNGANASRVLLRKKPRRSRTARSCSLDRKNRGEVEKSGEEDGDSSDDEDERDMEEDESLRAGFTELLVSDGGMDARSEAFSQEPSTATSPSALNGLLMDSDEEEDKEQDMEKWNSIAPEDIHYVFDRMIFTGGK